MPGFARAALKKIYNEKSINLLLKREGGKDIDISYSDRVGYRTYKSLDELNEHMNRRDSISAVVDNETEKIYCSFASPLGKQWVVLVYDKEKIFKKWGSWNTEISLLESNDSPGLNRTNMLWLPRRDGRRKLYTGIDENWLELVKDGATGQFSFELPEVHSVKY